LANLQSVESFTLDSRCPIRECEPEDRSSESSLESFSLESDSSQSILDGLRAPVAQANRLSREIWESMVQVGCCDAMLTYGSRSLEQSPVPSSGFVATSEGRQ
jgi:hypothetical protein